LELDERQLARRFCAGDRDAFDELFDRYSGRVLGFATRLTGSRSDAEDLVQDTFLAACGAYATFKQRSGILTWLLGITVRRWRDGSRRLTPEMVSFDEDLDSDSPELHSEGNPVERQVVTAVSLAEALDKLDPPFRIALVLVASQGLTYKEAAEATGEPVGTVKWRVSEASRRVRQALSTRGGEGYEL
jgi:RNA polymerase sigma-70 factor, ECF subfamily